MRWQVLLLGLVASATTVQAQLAPNLTYDGRPTIARLKYTPVSNPEACQGTDSPAGPGWGHDYPMSVQGLLTAVKELTNTEVANDSNLVLTIDDPEIMKHPISMLTEPGCWNPNETETKALRSYLLKGGFLIADDFTFFDCTPEHCELAIQRFEEWMKRVLPEGRVVTLSATDPIFDGFFKIDPLNIPGFSAAPTQIVGIYEDNDPSKRLLVVGTYWNALGHFWRYVSNDIGSGIEQGGASYRLGLNYFIYALSH